MILVLAIILFIIFLIYSIKPSKSEEYTLEGLKLSWVNKASIEGIVTKWIVTLKDSSGSVIHMYENSDAGNLKDFTDVTMNIVDKKEFDEKIIGDNTLELYYNDIKPDTKLYTKTVTFTRDDFGMSLDTSNLEEIDIPEPETFTYELIMNKKNASLGIHIEYIKLDGVLATKAQTTIHKNPNRNNKPDNMFSVGSGTENYAAWNSNGHNVGDKIFTIVSNKKVDKIDIVYTRPRYAPGWIIKENGVTKITETSNRGNNADPRPVVYTYDIKNGKSTIFSIPHQIPPGNADGWCNHANAVHQDVPGCGRICSDPSNAGRKNKSTFVPWNKYPGSVECTAAKLDEVYQYLNGKRSLRVGKVSGAEAMDLTGGFKWYYYKGSYFSDISSFSGKTPTKQGDNVTDFSSKHKATSGHLRNDGNEDNYAVKWEGYFVPKKTGSHKFWTESDDMSYLTIDGVVAVDNGGLHGMVKAPKNELNPPESSRKYSTVYSNQAPGVGHARSMLDSDQAWSAAHNVVDQWMEIDMGAKNFIAGVVVQGRKGSTQRVTSFDVSIDGKKITSTLKYTSSKDTRQTYTFGKPVVGRKVRFRVKGWNSHASMRAGVIPAKTINLTAGKKYPIKIYFSEKGGGDEVKVWFQGPGMNSATHNFSGYMLK
jgi:hypothetical protein